MTAAAFHPVPLASHQGVYPGQIWQNQLGTQYRVCACMSDGYIHVQKVTKSASRETKPLWVDLFLNWSLTANSPIQANGVPLAAVKAKA